MRQAEFHIQLTNLLAAGVEGMDRTTQLATVRDLLDSLAPSLSVPRCAFVPFMRGRRPVDEVTSPGLGSSEDVGLVLAEGSEQDSLQLLFHVSGVEDGDHLDLDLSFAFIDDAGTATPIPGWTHAPLEPARLAMSASGEVVTEPCGLETWRQGAFAISINLADLVLPDNAWAWTDLGSAFRAQATEPDPLSFGHGFHQQVEAVLRLRRGEVVLSASSTRVEIVDARRLGSLYQRVLERIVVVDTARQAKAAGLRSLSHEYHPWYPVLKIGSHKADLYMQALVADIAGSGRFFSNPHWLLDVGLYLELLTCIGIFEAVKDDLGDPLTPEERYAFEHNVAYAKLRKKVNVDAWRKVWKTRHIAFDGVRVPQLGPVQATNLLRKRQATLAFLHAHHDDLKWAIELAGPNPYNAQESWHRVFRDAERAVLHQVAAAFPELNAVPETVRQLVLWTRKGDKAGNRLGAMAKPLLSLLGEDDGLFATACNQYRASMNEVAEWAAQRGLMSHAGDECVPLQVSLLHAHMEGELTRLARLQRHDGYGPTLLAREAPQELPTTSVAAVEALLGRVRLFSVLTPEERGELAASIRCISLAPMERILIEGAAGSSLFVVAEGRLDVLQRRAEKDVVIATLGVASVFGEVSLFTGAPRGATVRAIDGAVVWEIAQGNLRPLIEARPKLVEAFAELIEGRSVVSTSNSESPRSLAARIRSLFF